MQGLKHPKRSKLPCLIRERIIAEYMSGVKTPLMLSQEYPLSRNAIIKMVSRYLQGENSSTFDHKRILGPMRPKITAELVNDKLTMENMELRRQLQLAQLKLEGFEIMGDILEQEYGIDLLKKQEPNSVVPQRKASRSRLAYYLSAV